MGVLDPVGVEASLAAYYNQEGDERCRRTIDPRRLAARDRFVASLVGQRRSVLEIGSGPGRDAIAFVEAGHALVAVDLSIEHARRCSATGAGIAVATVRSLPFPAASFDAVWTMSVLMHVPDVAIDAALAEVRRVLRPDGAAAIGVWGGPDVEDQGDEDLDRGKPARLFSRRSDERWLAMLAAIGDVENFETWHVTDDFHYQLAMVRRSR